MGINKEVVDFYEKENPGKKALWRGKETKGFIAFREQVIQTKKEELGAEIVKSPVKDIAAAAAQPAV